jgi:hypothetical protein
MRGAYFFGYSKGEKPITKNIRVTDANGVIIGATYLKRAKGLVKHGRARFTDEHTLCLTRPPVGSPANNLYPEDNEMENILTNNEINKLTETFDDRGNGPRPEAKAKPAVAEAAKQDESGGGELTMEWIMTRFDMIMNDKAYFNHAIDAMKTIPLSKHGASDSIIAGIRAAIKEREETNRQLLSMLSMMYAQLNSKNPPPQFNPASFSIPPLNPIPPLPPTRPSNQTEQPSFSGMINAIRGIDWSELPDEIGEAICEAIECKSLKADNLKKMLDEIRSVDWDEVPDEVREAVAESFRRAIS